MTFDADTLRQQIPFYLTAEPAQKVLLAELKAQGLAYRAASRSGLIDMTGSLLPGIDGFNLKMNVSILSLMRQCTDYALRYSHRSVRWFGPVLEKHFFE